MKSKLFVLTIVVFLNASCLNIFAKPVNPGQANKVVFQDTVLYLKFDGNIKDCSKIGNNGTIHGNTKYVTGAHGIGQAIYLNGDENYVVIPDYESLHLNKEFTIEFWMKFAQPQNAKTKIERVSIIRKENGDSFYDCSYLMFLSGSKEEMGLINALHGEDVTQYFVVYFSEFKYDTWYKIIYALNKKLVRVLIEDESGRIIGYYFVEVIDKFIYNQGELYIGGMGEISGRKGKKENFPDFMGSIDDVKIMNYALNLEDRFYRAIQKMEINQRTQLLNGLAGNYYNYKYSFQNTPEPGLKFLNQLLTVDSSRTEIYFPKWKLQLRLAEKTDEIKKNIMSDIHSLLTLRSDNEEALLTGIKGYRIAGASQKRKMLEDKSVEMFPDGEVAHKRKVNKLYPNLKRVYLEALEISEQEIYPDLIIGEIPDSVDVEEVNPNEVFFGLGGFLLDSQNNIYAYERTTDKISLFNGDGKFIREIVGDKKVQKLLAQLSGVVFDSTGSMLCISSNKKNGSVFRVNPDGSSAILGKHKALRKLWNLIPASNGLWTESRYYLDLGYKNDIKGDKLKQLKLDDGIIELYNVSFLKKNKIKVNKVGSVVEPLTDGGTLDGKLPFTLFMLNEIAYDFDELGNVYVAHRYLPRFRKFDPDGNLIFDFEFNYYDEKEVRPVFSQRNYKLLFCFSGIKTTQTGECFIRRGGTVYHTDPDGNIIHIYNLKEKTGDRHFWISDINFFQTAISKNGEYYYCIRDNKIYRFKIGK